MITPSVSSSASEIVTAARAPEYQLEAPQSSSRRPRLLSLPQLASQQSQDERPRHEEQSKFCSDSHRRQQLVNAEERDAIKHQVFVENDNGVKSKSKAQLKYTQRRQQFVCRIDDSNQKNHSPASCIPLCTTSKSPHQILTTLNSKNPTAAVNNQAIIIRSQSSAPVISTQRAAVRVLTSTAGGGGGCFDGAAYSGGGGGGPGPGPGSATGGPSLGLGSFSSLSQTSPPPPRRTPTGKTLIVPLATNKGRAPLAPLLGTAAAAAADGRLTSQSSLDNATSKSFTTIPEDDDELKYHSSSSSTDAAASNDGVLHTQTTLANRSTNRLYDSADLISIDRTSISCAESRPLHYNCLSGVSLPPSAPEFEIPVPSYAPPPPPAQTALSDPALYRPSLFIRSPKSISRREFLTMTAAAAATADSSNNSSSQMSGQTRTRKSPSGDSLNSFSRSVIRKQLKLLNQPTA
ncbi:unnamed protein product [Anisakis simplex]|uniref:SH2 domain-containing protein n=1 Tax=Anisakis simplex TaxID=6269 RepID=A0A0M3J3V7_ANISI|nr:unnamed protein product [Anisakis simplex]